MAKKVNKNKGLPLIDSGCLKDKEHARCLAQRMKVFFPKWFALSAFSRPFTFFYRISTDFCLFICFCYFLKIIFIVFTEKKLYFPTLFPPSFV